MNENNVKLKFKGKKMILFGKKYDAPRNSYVPMFNGKQEIIGHQFIPSNDGKGIYVQMPVLNEDDWNFKTDIASSDIKLIYQE